MQMYLIGHSLNQVLIVNYNCSSMQTASSLLYLHGSLIGVGMKLSMLLTLDTSPALQLCQFSFCCSVMKHCQIIKAFYTFRLLSFTVKII